MIGKPDHYDVVIIGSGAGGGTLAWRLAPSGKRILLLERGDFLPREPQNWDAEAVYVRGRYRDDVWYDGRGRPFQPETYHVVGGNTKMYGAILARLRPKDFGELEHYGGISPAWPLTYEDLEPYYTKAEQLYQVHGARDADPTEPPATEPYPFPPVSHEPRIQELHDALQAAGYHPSPTPLAIMLDEQNPANNKCARCATCAGFSCMLHAKADAEVIAVRPALKHQNVTLLTGARAIKLETSPSGREVRRVVVERNGRRECYSGDIVVVSAGASHSAHLLLASANDRHPRGLANDSDQVGRNYMIHNRSALMALFPRINPTLFQMTLALNDFYFGDGASKYPWGRMHMLPKTSAAILRGKGPRFLPRKLLDGVARRSVDFFLTSEDLPDPQNRVTVRSDGQLQLRYRPNNLKAMRCLETKVKSIIHGLGRYHPSFVHGLCIVHRVPLEGLGHQAGTCKFGTDPRTSVLDVHCKAHSVDNLYVVDGSFFPSCGAMNPSLTIIANALRVGEHLLERLGVHDAAPVHQ